MEPLVSVIMPAYNGEKYIGEAIRSILNQTYSNWELVIIDDASMDNTLDVVYKFKDKRIKLFCNSINKGIASSTNFGIAKSSGKYIALLDDDDIAESNRLRVQVDYLEKHTEIDILGGRTTLINEEGEIIDYVKKPRYNPKYIKAVLLFNCMDFMNGTAMIRKEFIVKNQLFYKNNCYGMQDYRFYIESSKLGNISTIENFLLKYRVHRENETQRNFKFYEKEREKLYAEFQRYSIQQSGFRLKENELALLNKVLKERNGKCDSKQEYMHLHGIFKKMIDQGKSMNIDYIDELQHVCKVKMSEQLIKLENIFE